MSFDWVGAFFVGLIGAGHCMGMCGGIASMLSIGQSKPNLMLPIYYNVGRLASYTLIGALVGGTLSSLANLGHATNTLSVLRLVAAIFMILLALYIGKWWHGLVYIEKAGKRIWKWIAPFANRLLPLKHPLYAMPFGFLWGWLPCGLVYSALSWSAVSGSAINGALLMLAFGVGTLPAMLLVGYGASYLQAFQKSTIFRNTGAVLLLVYGLYTAYGALSFLSLSA